MLSQSCRVGTLKPKEDSGARPSNLTMGRWHRDWGGSMHEERGEQEGA